MGFGRPRADRREAHGASWGRGAERARRRRRHIVDRAPRAGTHRGKTKPLWDRAAPSYRTYAQRRAFSLSFLFLVILFCRSPGERASRSLLPVTASAPGND